MIQRKQTLWLLFAAIAALLTLKFPFYTGNTIKDTVTGIKSFEQLNARFDILITILSVAIGVAALITIFLYSDRKKQILFTAINCVVSIVVIVLYYLQTKKFVDGAYSITSILVLAVPVLLIMAIVGINKDEKLIKSVDRLR
ncbi:unnamed protein product [Rotaria sp. Silwood1]|nr:unnamed protein product [Rotaria sp. Silwood1]